jgi:divalent metal cation (Fe/Co/Zn/Cd) transporter
MAEFSGPRIVVDLHVNVSGDTELIDTHRIEDEVMAQILQLPEIDRVYVHIEPDEWEG